MVDRQRAEYEQLRKALRELRHERGLTQEQLASRLGVRQLQVSRTETGERRLDAVELTDWATALGVGVAEIYARAGIEHEQADGTQAG